MWRLVPAQCLCSKKSSCEKGVDWKSEGEESEGRTKDWKWSGAVVARVWKRDGVEARAGSWYPGHQQWLGGSKS